MACQSADRYIIKPVVGAFRILEVLRDAGTPLSMTEISACTQISKTTIFRYLKTLSALGYVTAVGRSYTIGIAALSLGSSDTWEVSLLALGREHLDQLTERFGETSNLGVPKGKRISYLAVVEPDGSVGFSTESGDADRFHCTALGKAMLAYMPADVAAMHLNSSLPGITEHTITDRRKLDCALSGVRRFGYAVDREENRPGCICYAAPVFVDGDTPIAAISVTLPKSRLTDRLDLLIPETVKEHAGEISRALNQRDVGGIASDLWRSRRGTSAAALSAHG